MKSAYFERFQKFDFPIREGPRGGENFSPIFSCSLAKKYPRKKVSDFSQQYFDFCATAEKNRNDRARIRGILIHLLLPVRKDAAQNKML